ncbi:MAG: DNA primase [Cellvibrionales bacterium]|nr:DNA primase [Cellvibrionales bacterium]
MSQHIPQSFIDDLLDRTELVDLISGYVKLKKTGSNYMACCPFHNEKTPSFSVNPNKQFYYCFGCGASGNALGFLMDYEKRSFPEAIETLAHMNGMQVPYEKANNKPNQPKKTSLYDLLLASQNFYEDQLKDHQDKQIAIDYLKGRGLSGETCKTFGVGFAPEGWNNLQNKLATTNEKLKGLIETGMLIENTEKQSLYDRFRYRLIFPIRDARGRTIGFGGRVFDNSKPKYLNSPETPVFQKQSELYGLYEAKQANRHIEELLVVEGYMDVVALYEHGIQNAVATLGTSISSKHLNKIFRICPTVVFCFDGDEAGRKAANRAFETVLPQMEDGRQAKFLFLPEGEDPDSLVQTKGKTAFLNQVDKSLRLSEYLFERLTKALDLSTPDDRAKLIAEATQFIFKLPIGSYQTLMLQELSLKTGLSIEAIQQLKPSQPTIPSPAYHPAENSPRLQSNPAPPTDNKNDSVTLTAIKLLLFNPAFAQQAQDLNDLTIDPSEKAILILRSLINQIHQQPDISTATLIGQAMANEKNIIEKSLSLKFIEVDENQSLKEYKDHINHIYKQNNRINVKSFIESTKLNRNITLNDMSSEQKEKFLALFNRESDK